MVSFGWVKPFYEATNRRKLEGFTCVKLKIAIDFEEKRLFYYGILGNILLQNRLKSE
jgi:hypothetical protein